MDGIILINKEKGFTSRDVVNIISKKLNTRKIGHTGTLDPLATGLMVLCVNNGCKLVEMLTSHDKDYIAKVRVGFQTDTYDITGKIINEKRNFSLDKETLENCLKSFLPGYEQTVPFYSSIKVNGQKLYKYARNGEEIILPKRMVEIKEIKLLSYNGESFTFFVSVSKGTYIRSLINDIGQKLDIPMTMEELTRTRVGKYKLEEAGSVESFNIISLANALDILKREVKDDILLKKIVNGALIKSIDNCDKVLFTKNGEALAIYIKNDEKTMRCYKNLSFKFVK